MISILGMTDPWTIAAYAGCFLTVLMCCAYALMGRNDKGDEK